MKLAGFREKWKKAGNRNIWIDLAVILLTVTVVMLTAYRMNGIYPFGEESVARGDMTQQTIPAGMYYVWDVLHGKASPFFTWNSGLGMSITGAAALGAHLSPLNLFLYFSPRAFLFYFANILLILKMVAIAWAMYFYLRKYRVQRAVHIAGGLLYAFGAASLVHFQIMLVMDIAFLLPLIMIGVDRMYEKKKCAVFIVFLALSLAINVYTGCITLVYLLLASGMKTYSGTYSDRKERKAWILRLGLSVLAAALLSAVLSLPALYSISQTSRMGDSDAWNTYLTALQAQWSDYDWKTVERMCVNMALPFACILGFLARGTGRLGERLRRYAGQIILVLCLMLSVAIPSIELLWHGGSRASWPVRFIYVLSFVIIDFAVLLYRDQSGASTDGGETVVSGRSRRAKTEWETAGYRYAVSVCICLVACLLGGKLFHRFYESYCANGVYATLGDGFLCMAIEAVFAGLYLFHLHSRRGRMGAMVLLCVQLTATSILSFAPNKDNATVFNAAYLEAANNVAKSMKTEIEDFARIKNSDYKIDHIEYSLVLGEEAISNYWHVINPDLQPDFAALGYSINWTQCLDSGGTVFSDTLLHMQYALSYHGLSEDLYTYCETTEGQKGEKIGLYRNNLELPFAIQTDTAELAGSGELFATQNSLFQAVTGSSDTLITDVSAQIENNTFQDRLEDGKKVLYFYGTNSTEQQVTITVNGENVIVPNSDSAENIQYPVDFGNGLLCLGCFEDEDVTVTFTGEADASNYHLGVLDYDMLTTAVASVNDQNPEISTLSQKRSGVNLTVKNVTKSNLFLPVSCDDGWTCTVNGKKTEMHSIDGMLSIPVEQGTNEIVLRYHAPGRGIGAVLSLLGLAACLACVWLQKRKASVMERAETVLAGIAYEIYVAVYAVFVAVLFVLPTLYYLITTFIVTQ